MTSENSSHQSTQPSGPSDGPSCAVASGSGAPLFDPRLLARCLMSKDDAAKFRQEARMDIVRDKATDARVVCYIHPDGRILIDAVRLPNVKDEPARSCEAKQQDGQP